MKTDEIIIFTVPITLFAASCISLIFFAIAGKADNPSGIPAVPFPALLQAGTHATADQILVKTVRPIVLTKDERDVFNAVVSDLQNRGGVVTEYSTSNRTLTAIVPASYLDRLSLLDPEPGQRLTPEYRAWVADVPHSALPTQPGGPLVQVKVDLDDHIYSSGAISAAMFASWVALIFGIAGMFIAAGITGKLDS